VAVAKTRNSDSLAFLFDLDGTLIDSVYQHVLAWREATQAAGIELPVWRIHRQIGMSEGLMLNALSRETGRPVSRKGAERIQRVHAEAYAKQAPVGSSDQCNTLWDTVELEGDHDGILWDVRACPRPRKRICGSGGNKGSR
jgi:beta-phosphoglucomutase-like phosphatase (HAD superfamily)